MVSDSRLRGAILLTLLAAGAGLHAGAEPQPAGAPVALKATLIESGLDFTINLTSPRNDSRRIFILERGGVIWLRKDGVRLPTPFVDLTSVTGGGHEWGVFALAFHPVSRHDGVVSVMRGFTREELRMIVREALGIEPEVHNRLGYRVTARWRPSGDTK